MARKPPPNPGPGRPKGRLNKVTREARELAHALILEDEDYLRGLYQRIKRGKAPTMETLLWAYGFGKPVDKLKIEGDLAIHDAQKSVRRKLGEMLERIRKGEGE